MKRNRVFTLAGSIGLILFVVAVLLGASSFQAVAKPIELSFSLHVPPKAAPYHGAFLPFAKEIEKRTNGRVKIKFYLSQTLVKARDSYDAIVNGAADISFVALSWTPGRFPLSCVMELPYMVPSTFTGAHVLMDLYKKFPQIRAELKDVHLLFLWTTLPYEIHTVKKPVRKLEDMKGMKLATQPGARAALEALGSVPVTMPSPQLYQTVEKGVADGSALAWGAFKAWKLVEVTKYHTNAHIGGTAYCTIMNKNTWNKLPKDIQEIITDINNQMMPDTLCAAVSAEMKVGMQQCRDRNQEIYEMPAKERARWVATGKPAWDKWVKDMEAKGLPGRAVLEEAIRLTEKHKR